MRRDRVILNYLRLPVPQKVEKGRKVIMNMKGNPKFNNPVVSLDELEAKTNLLEERSLAAQNSGKEAKAMMHQTETEWDDMMRKLALYVDLIADGDSAMILNAGFDLAKQPAPAIRPDFSVEQGEKSGSVVLHRQAVEGARSYIWQYCLGEKPAEDADWILASVTTKVTTEINGLIPLNSYWFRVAVVTATGTSVFNYPIMQIVI